MRVRLYPEGVTTEFGGARRRLERTQWEDKPIPALVQPPNNDDGTMPFVEVIGWITDLRREREYVVGEVSLEPGANITGLHAQAEFDAGPLGSIEGDRGVQVFPGAILRSVLFGEQPCWPGLEVR
jgi:hypothetical protein